MKYSALQIGTFGATIPACAVCEPSKSGSQNAESNRQAGLVTAPLASSREPRQGKGSMYSSMIYFALEVGTLGPKYLIYGHLDPLGLCSEQVATS